MGLGICWGHSDFSAEMKLAVGALKRDCSAVPSEAPLESNQKQKKSLRRRGFASET